MTIPNLVSLARIALIPSVIFFLWSPAANLLGISYRYLACGLFALLAGSDWLDGYLARRLKMSSNTGKLLDPLADKLLVVAVLLVMVDQRYVSVAAVGLLIARDMTISIFRAVAAEKGVVLAAEFIGKLKTVIQYLAICMLMLALPFANETLWIGVVLSLVSGVQIIWQNRQVLEK